MNPKSRRLTGAYTMADGKAQRHLLRDATSPQVSWCGLNPRPSYWENQNSEGVDDSLWLLPSYCRVCLDAAGIPKPLEAQIRAWFQDHDELGKGTFLRCPQCGAGMAARWRSGSLQVTCKTTCGDCERSEDTRVWPDWRGLEEYPQKQMDEVIEDEYYRDYKRSIGEEEE